MNCRLSKTKIESYQGDVLPLRLLGEENLTAAEIEWSVAGDCVTVRSFRGNMPHSFNDGVMLTLVEVGEATVSATYGGETYTCAVTVRPMKRPPPRTSFAIIEAISIAIPRRSIRRLPLRRIRAVSPTTFSR